MSDTVLQRVIYIAIRQLGIDDMTILPEHYIADDLGADSLDLIEMVMEAEEEFEIDISDDEAEKVRTIQDAADLIERILSA